MEVIKTDIDGVVIIEPRIFSDERGYFFESFSQREFEEKVCKNRFRPRQRVEILLRSFARIAFPETAIYPKQTGAST